MPRYRQVIQEDGSSKFVEIGVGAKTADAAPVVFGDVEPFVSPIDGTVISDRKQYREHCKKHNVVPAAEFSQEFYDRKAAERARVYNGERTKQQELADKRQIYEVINALERRG